MTKRKGFTLIELIAAIVILGVLAAVAVILISRLTSNAKSKKMDYIINMLKLSAEVKYNTDQEKSMYNINELVDNPAIDLKSPYGDLLSGYVYNYCPDNNCSFVPCIYSNNYRSPNMHISEYNNMTCLPSDEQIEGDSESSLQRSEASKEMYNYDGIINLLDSDNTDDISSLEDMYYKAKNYAIKDNKLIEIERGKNLFNYVKYKGKKRFELHGLILANDGNNVWVLIYRQQFHNFHKLNKQVDRKTKEETEVNTPESGSVTNIIEKASKNILDGDELRLLSIGDINAMSYKLSDNEYKTSSQLYWIEPEFEYWVETNEKGVNYPYDIRSADDKNINGCTYLKRTITNGEDHFVLQKSKCNERNAYMAFVLKTTVDRVEDVTTLYEDNN